MHAIYTHLGAVGTVGGVRTVGAVEDEHIIHS